MAGDNKLPTLGVIYIISVIIVALQKFSGESFGALGNISWIIVIAGAIGFVLSIIPNLKN